MLRDRSDAARTRRSLWPAMALLLSISIARSAPVTPAAASAAGNGAVLAQLEALRDAFLKRIDEEGYKFKSCAVPQIELGDPPSFGRFDAERNVLVISGWNHLTNEERKSFEDMAQQMGTAASGEQVFENGTNRWVLVHELGHWWQSCRHQARPQSYAAENGADRIALAFWREHDPRYATGVVHGYRALLTSMRSPVPEGQSAPAYFDANVTQVSQGDAYTWFQANMIAGLAEEQPPPSLHKALSQPLYPH
jgi:hypothetical protein